MGMVQIKMMGSFGVKQFDASATEGGHVCAIKRSIEFLASELGEAVKKDAKCTVDGVVPPNSPLGEDVKT
jgi:hypothetical protein